MNLQTESDIVQLVLSSQIESKMRLIIISSLVVIVNYSSHALKIFSMAADNGEKLDGVKRNEIATKNFTEVSECGKTSDKQGQPIAAFADLIGSKGRRRINTNFSSLIAFGSKSEEASFPIKVQSMMRKCLNVPCGDKSIPISVSIIKHNEQYFISIHDDPSPFMSIKNETDFNLYVAQTDLSNPNAKYILPHREVCDERFSWFQAVPAKQRIFYTPPIINELFPEITNPDFGIIFACVTGDDFIRWSQPIRIDGTKKIIINVPMFGDVQLNVDFQKKMAQINIGYIQNEKDNTVPKTDPSRDHYRRVSQESFMDVNSNYQRSFSLLKKASKKAFNFNFYSAGINITIYRDGDKKRTDLISLNIDEIGVKYSKLACKLKMNFSKIQVDNELYESTGDYDFPVVLCNKDMAKASSHQVSNTSIWDLSEIIDSQNRYLMFSIEIDLYEKTGIENVIVKVQPIRLYIEDTFINVLLEIFDDCLPTNLIAESTKDFQRILLTNGMVLVPNAVDLQAQYLSEPFRLKSIRLESLHILLSVHTCMR